MYLFPFKKIAKFQADLESGLCISDKLAKELNDYIIILFSYTGYVTALSEYLESDQQGSFPLSWRVGGNYPSKYFDKYPPDDIEKAKFLLPRLIRNYYRHLNKLPQGVPIRIYVYDLYESAGEDEKVNQKELECSYEYLLETIDVALSYTEQFLKNNTDVLSIYFCRTTIDKPTIDIPYRNIQNKGEYLKYFKRVHIDDRPYFATLCRIFIWNSYVTESKKVKIHIKGHKPLIVVPVQITDSKPNLNCSVDLTDYFSTDKETNSMSNTLTRFKDVVQQEVTLVHGRPHDEWTEEELIKLIRETSASIEAICDLIPVSRKMADKVAQYEENIKVYAALLDNLPNK